LEQGWRRVLAISFRLKPRLGVVGKGGVSGPRQGTWRSVVPVLVINSSGLEIEAQDAQAE
jgi:hypothetical protein